MMMQKAKIVLIGGGGHARSVFDAIESGGTYEVSGFVDADPELQGYRGATFFGPDSVLPYVRETGVSFAHVSVGYLGKGMLREKLAELSEAAGFTFPAIVDPSAVIAADAEVGSGSFVGKLAVVNSAASIGRHCIINSGSVIEHDVVVEDFSHVAPRAVICGEARIGRCAFIAAGAVVGPGVTVGAGSVVSAGCILLSDLGDSQLAIGCPTVTKRWQR